MGKKRHPIQVVARRAGLTPELLRAWEKRYGVVEPGRTGGGQRLYSDEDIQRLRLLRLAIQGGRRIGNVSSLETAELVALIEEDRGEGFSEAVESPTVDEQVEGANRRPARVVEDALDAALALDEPRLTHLLERAVILTRPETLISEILAPLMRRVGELWHEGEIRPAHEHLLSSVVRGVLSRITVASQPQEAPHHLVVATPMGQRHEIGAMLAAATAAMEGWRVTYLGADLPAEDIATVVQETRAEAVALSIVHPEADSALDRDLRGLRKLLPSDTEIIVGGAAASSYGAALEKARALFIQDLDDLRSTLLEISGSTNA